MIIKEFSEFEANMGVGDWCFINQDTHIAICLGKGEFDFCILPINATGDNSHWKWDGNKDAPTLSPSILHWGNGRNSPPTWHGFLEQGILRRI